MSSSWHDFLYASLDPSGVMTVDKPPLALWVQALSVRVFGYHPLSMLVPQALMGVASVGARVRPRAPPLRPARRVRRRPRARADADRRWRSRATTTPTRCSCCAAWRRCGARCVRSRTAARAGWCCRACAWVSASRRRWLVALVGRAGHRARPGCGSRPRTAAGVHALRQLLAGGARWCSSAARGRRSWN